MRDLSLAELLQKQLEIIAQFNDYDLGLNYLVYGATLFNGHGLEATTPSQSRSTETNRLYGMAQNAKLLLNDLFGKSAHQHQSVLKLFIENFESILERTRKSGTGIERPYYREEEAIFQELGKILVCIDDTSPAYHLKNPKLDSLCKDAIAAGIPLSDIIGAPKNFAIDMEKILESKPVLEYLTTVFQIDPAKLKDAIAICDHYTYSAFAQPLIAKLFEQAYANGETFADLDPNLYINEVRSLSRHPEYLKAKIAQMQRGEFSLRGMFEKGRDALGDDIKAVESLLKDTAKPISEIKVTKSVDKGGEHKGRGRDGEVD